MPSMAHTSTTDLPRSSAQVSRPGGGGGGGGGVNQHLHPKALDTSVDIDAPFPPLGSSNANDPSVEVAFDRARE